MIEQDQRLSRKPSGLLKKSVALRAAYLDRMLFLEWPCQIATAHLDEKVKSFASGWTAARRTYEGWRQSAFVQLILTPQVNALSMIRLLTIVTASVALASCGSASAQCATHDAQGLVASIKPAKQFRSILTMAVGRTQTAAMVKARDGASGDQKLAQAIDAAVKRHSAEWEKNLVSSWQSLSAAEIGQACTAMQKNDRRSFMPFAERIGPRVQSLNEPQLRSATKEVLKTAW